MKKTHINSFHQITFLIFSLLVFNVNNIAFSSSLEIQHYVSKNSGIGELSVILLGKKQAVLIDSQWKPSDAKNVAKIIADSGRELTHILITHGHPDHYWGLATILETFPNAKVLARKGTRDEIKNQFAAKWIHWQPLMGEDMPLTPVLPELLKGDKLMLEGEEIRFVDLPINEVEHSVAYYVPSKKALIAGDLIFSKMHAYFADLNNPAGWVEALKFVKNVGPIETVYPGHGPVGGADLIDEAIHYMEVYQSFAKPGVPLPKIIKAMTSEFPNYGGEIILWWTRGPSFGIFGPRSQGVPEELIATLPSHLVGSVPGCSAANKLLVEKLFYQGFSGGRMDILDEVISKEIQFVDPMFPKGLAGIKALVKKNNSSFEGWHFKINDILCDADKVVVRWMGSGKHVASFMGEKVTGNMVELSGISIYQIKANKIVADWVVPDNLGFLMQIGVLQPTDMTKDNYE
jgi:glyoxylase-like metal-dependent hydrolase (beta-lactamase superfamily II)/predicted ester cyclase